MTVLHIDTGRTMRGGQHQVRLLMNGLRSQGHECRLLARRQSPLARLSTEGGFAVRPANLWEIGRQSHLVDIVHAHDARAHTMAAIACPGRFVVSRRVAFPVQTTAVSRWKYRRAARYLAVSQWVANELVKAGVLAGRIDVVFDAVEENDYASGWNAENPVVAPAFHNDPDKLSQLTREACDIAQTKLVLSSDLKRDLPHAAAFVYLTKSEGLGSAALLAMEMGVPVIATRVQGLAEVLEQDRSGLYVPELKEEESPREYAAQVAACIRRVLEEPGLASRLIAAARERVRKRFSLEKMVAGTLACYERALAG